MINATDLKAGKTFELNGIPYKVEKYIHQKIARGGGTIKLSVRNLENGNLEDKTLSSSKKVNEINTVKKAMQYLFKDDLNAVFMDPRTFEQIQIPLHLIKEQLLYIKEGGQVDILFWSFDNTQDQDDKALSVDLPPNIALIVKETAPGVKGNTASNVYKPAKLENGLNVKVPLFIKQGDKVRVDTRTGEYVERVK